MTLPVFDILDELKARLRDQPNAVLIAPPGAGKTTAVAPALLDEPWCTEQILLLSPRRLAARAAAERMAELAGEPVGKTIGYATRMDTKQSAGTRILALTEGVFRNRIIADSELKGVSAVLFDEVHERSLDNDFGLALALDAQAVLRPDLRLLAMSATLDGARFAALMGAPVIESEGRSYPLELRHIGRRAEAPIEAEMAAAIRRALAEEDGGILAFLPGVAEIERTAERLTNLPGNVWLHRLHGQLDPREQRAAIAPAPFCQRKLVLATSIAETSLTLDGIRIVIDSGLARRPRYDRAAGVARLVTERASQAAVTQRAGRAARQTAGVAYRLWEEAATKGMPPFDPPEILEADLSALLLDCAIWGAADPLTLDWLDPPPKGALAEARTRLTELGALDPDGRAMGHGRAMAKLPLPPRLAHMMIAAGERGFAGVASEMAVLLSERGLGGTSADLADRLERWRRERSPRAEAARKLAARLGQIRRPREGGGLPGESGACPSQHGPRSSSAHSGPGLRRGDELGWLVALAYPDRVARRRDASGEQWLSAGGRGYRLDPASPLAKAEWLAIADVQGSAAGARILAAAALDAVAVEALFADRIESGVEARFDPETGGVGVMGGRRLGAVPLGKADPGQVPQDEIERALLEGVRTHGLPVLNWSDAATSLRERARWAGIDALSDEALLETLDRWLAPLLTGERRVPGVGADALLNLLDWPERQALDRLAPAHFTTPAGTTHAIDYAAPGGPTVELRVQALFGLATHPAIGPDQTPLILLLTSPAGRPIQTTRDLPGFWAGSWKDVVKDMRGRYPKHNWPDDALVAPASLKTKKALDRSG